MINRLHFKAIIVISMLLFAYNCIASVQVYSFKPHGSPDRYLIVAQDGETPQEALKRYVHLIHRNKSLLELIGSENFIQFKSGQFSKIEETVSPDKTLVLLLANRSSDMTYDSQQSPQMRINKFKQKLNQEHDVYILPVAGAIGLTHPNRDLYYKQISHIFSGVIALGGHDVNPALYNEKVTYSRDVNPVRDQYEINFLKYWIQNRKGFLFGVCRGHQLISAALGFKLSQHIDYHGDGEWTDHKIYLHKTQNGYLYDALKVKELAVNSYHHQAVIYKNHPLVDLAATGPDGTVEALESRDGRIMTTQFHIEFMDNIYAQRFFKYLSYKIKSSSVSKTLKCSNLF
ncbi:MAG: gamma-glutamyl-gamma-aminobutyrate hydrolase family protein [Pseudobdellovibrio sp.]